MRSLARGLVSLQRPNVGADRRLEIQDPLDERRLRVAYQAAALIPERDAPEVVQAWFQGLNPQLDDRSPARLLREGDLDEVGPAVLGAARALAVRSTTSRSPRQPVRELIVDTARSGAIEELWDWQAALEACVARGAPDDYFWHNVGFRLVEMRLSGNEDLQRTLTSLGIRTLQFRHLSLSQPGRIEDSGHEHRRLLEAYEARDKEAAVTSTRKLIMSGFEAIQQSGLFPLSR